jgi:ketosteroid isomerase-like protein
MVKRIAVLAFVVCLTMGCFAQKATKAAAVGGIDRAYVEKIWKDWEGLDASKMTQYYAQGPHLFFDTAPLKYSNWDEYQAGVSKELAEYKAAKFKVNDDLQIHKAGDTYWVAATVASDMTKKSGKREMGQFRWTVVFEKKDGKWLIVHEHTSSPAD